jgi:transposase
VVRVPTIAEEDDRRLHDRLINERVQHVNRIKGLCALHGIYHYEPLRSDRMKRLEQLRTGDGRELPPRIKAEIRRELQRLELVLQMIKAIEKERNVMALGKAPTTYGNAKKVQQLAKIGSIGPEIATVPLVA